jgi:hypothetical protein
MVVARTYFVAVVPARAGTHAPRPIDSFVIMGPRLRGDDKGESLP